MQNINLEVVDDEFPSVYLGSILRTAIKTAFMRYFLDFTHASQKDAYEQLQNRIALEQDNEDKDKDMTRKRSRATTNEVWAQQEIETRTANRIVAAVHRLQFHFREASRGRKVKRIQNWYRYWRKFIPVANGVEDIKLYKGRDRVDGLDKHGLMCCAGAPITCAITQDAIPVKNSFKLIGPAGVVYAYTCSELIRYVRSTHKFECPATRNKLGVSEVRRLQRRATELGVNSGKSLTKEYFDRENTHNESVENGYALTGLESSATEMFDRAVYMCERGNIVQDLHLRLEGDILPEWREYVRMFFELDTAACLTMLRAEDRRVERLMLNGNVQHFAGYIYLREQLTEYINACSLRLRNTHSTPRRSIQSNRQPPPNLRVQPIDHDQLIESIFGNFGANMMNLEPDQWFHHRVLPTSAPLSSGVIPMTSPLNVALLQSTRQPSVPMLAPVFESAATLSRRVDVIRQQIDTLNRQAMAQAMAPRVNFNHRVSLLSQPPLPVVSQLQPEPEPEPEPVLVAPSAPPRRSRRLQNR